MGKFSSTVHIKINTDKSQFKNSFCNVIKNGGFEPCSEDEAALSYLLAFSKGSWVTLSSDGYSNNHNQAQEDVRRIAEAMKTRGFSVEVVDSDFAVLNLFGDNTDKVIVGDGSGYGINIMPRGKIKCWQPLLAQGRTWEQLSEIWIKNETFVEDVLCESAPILGIEPKYIIADYEELFDNADSDSDIDLLYFKKSADTKSKSMSLNAAFVKVFGEGLEPFGFKQLKKVKNKFPYFVRIINGEILHIVSYRTVTSSKSKHKCIEVLCGAATLYRRNIDFTMRPEEWLTSPTNLFRVFSEKLNIEPLFMEKTVREIEAKPIISAQMIDGKLSMVTQTLKETFGSNISCFHCKTNDNEEMLRSLKNAFNAAKSVMLPIFDMVSDLNSCVDYFYKAEQPLGWLGLCDFDEFITNERYSFSEGLILIKTGYRDDGLERIKNEAVLKIPSLGYQATPENIDKFLKEYAERQEGYRAEQLSLRNEMLDNPELNKRVMEELERCKDNNIEMFRSYGMLNTH